MISARCVERVRVVSLVSARRCAVGVKALEMLYTRFQQCCLFGAWPSSTTRAGEEHDHARGREVPQLHRAVVRNPAP